MASIRVLIADDHAVVRRGIVEVLRAAEGIEVVGEASSGAETLRMVDELRPQVLVLDIELMDMTGVDVMRALNGKDYAMAILGLSSYDDRGFIRELISLGAAGYLIKEETVDLIVEAVRGVADGEKGWLSRKVSASLGDSMMDVGERDWNLTAREAEVLGGIVEGKTNAEIALGLMISEKTVEKYVSGIFQKMGVSSRVEAAVKRSRIEMVKDSRGRKRGIGREGGVRQER